MLQQKQKLNILQERPLIVNLKMRLSFQEIGIGYGQNFIIIKNILVF